MRRVARVGRQVVVATGVVGAATAVTFLAGANAITAGLAYLITVLVLSAWQGFVAGAFASLLVTLALSYFFFPPIHDIRVDDPGNWVALLCFLIAATIASRLMVRERERTAVAESRRREIEALYDLCVDLFTSGATRDGLAAAAGRALRAIGVRSGGLALVGAGGELEPVSWIGSAPDLEVRRLVEFDLEGGAPVAGRPSEWRDLRIPIAIGEHQVGMLVAYGTRADRATLESVGRLVGLAVERERLFAEQARLEALKQSDALKTALLQAVSHDLSTPLTTIAILLESLRRALARHAEGSETVESIHQETARLQRRIENLLAMGRLEAGVFAPRREPTPSADLFRAAREHLALLASTRRLEVHVEPDCPDLDVDPSLVLEILVNLIENAHRSSPPAAAIELRARRHPRSAARVELEVLDRGRGLPPSWDEDGAVGAPPGDAGGMRKGLGLEIALRFAAALGGSVALKARDGGGVRAVIDLPAAALVAQEAAGEP